MRHPKQVTFRNKTAANRAAAMYRKQMGLGLNGEPRRYGKKRRALEMPELDKPKEG